MAHARKTRTAIALWMSAIAAAEHGPDVSWPMQRPLPEATLLSASQREQYQSFMKGCASSYDQELCDSNEESRIEINNQQPQHQTNYTTLGYAKVPAPQKAFNEVRRFWDTFHDTELKEEQWNEGNIYTNHWYSPTFTLLVDDFDGPSLPPIVRQHIIDDIRQVLEDWSGMELEHTSLFGIRMYQNNSILTPHVDRMPLVTSAIVNVAQDVEEDWPLEVIGHNGLARNITIKPGEMILYESHSVIHGRPYPLNGKYYSNIFCHFQPRGYTDEWHGRMDETEEL